MNNSNSQIIISECITKEDLINDIAKVLEKRSEQKKHFDEVLYIADVARKLKKSANHVRNLVRNKKINCLQEFKGATIMFREKHIEDYLHSLKTVSRAEENEEIRKFTNNPLSHDSNTH